MEGHGDTNDLSFEDSLSLVKETTCNKEQGQDLTGPYKQHVPLRKIFQSSKIISLCKKMYTIAYIICYMWGPYETVEDGVSSFTEDTGLLRECTRTGL